MSRVFKLLIKLILNIFIAPITIAKISARVYGETSEKQKRWWPYAIPSVTLFLLFIGFHVVELFVPGCWAIAWFFYLLFACQIAAVRIRTRELYGIPGNAIEDFFASMILYPNVTTQLDLTTDNQILRTNVSENQENQDQERHSYDNRSDGNNKNVKIEDNKTKFNYSYEEE